MGKRGPRPLPTALKKARGTHQKCRAPAQEMAPAPGLPPCPAYLDRIAREFWEELVPQLSELGVLTKIDGKTLEGLCTNYSAAVKFQKLADRKPMVDTLWGPKVNPAVGEARKSWALLKQFAAEFGLSPSSRTRVGGPAESKKSDAEQKVEKAAAFLFGGGGRLTALPGGKSGG